MSATRASSGDGDDDMVVVLPRRTTSVVLVAVVVLAPSDTSEVAVTAPPSVAGVGGGGVVDGCKVVERAEGVPVDEVGQEEARSAVRSREESSGVEGCWWYGAWYCCAGERRVMRDESEWVTMRECVWIGERGACFSNGGGGREREGGVDWR